MNAYFYLFILSNFLALSFEPPKPPIYKKPVPLLMASPKKKPKFEKPGHINLLVLFDECGMSSQVSQFAMKDESAEQDYIIANFINGILENFPMVMSSCIFMNFVRAVKNTYSSYALIFNYSANKTVNRKILLNQIIQILQKKWALYLSDDHSFCILLPNQLQSEPLNYWGFNQQKLLNFSLEPDLIHVKTLSPQPERKVLYALVDTIRTYPINPRSFNDLFDSSSFIRRRFFVGGHGASQKAKHEKSIIAQMDMETYREFLYILNYLNTDFALINSCFAGGYNLEQFHKELSDENKKIFSVTSLNYILAIASTSDKPAGIKFKEISNYFKNLDLYFENKNIKDLKNALRSIATPDSITSVRFPGSNSLFRVLELDKYIKIISSTSLKIHEMEYLQKGKPVAHIKIEEAREVLLYAAHIKVPIDIIITSESKKFVSMINGNALHIIDEIHYPISLGQLIADYFLQPSTQLAKAFFIKKFIKNTSNPFNYLENVCFSATRDKKGIIIFRMVSSDPQTNGKYIKTSLHALSQKQGTFITSKEAIDTIWKIIYQAMPTELSLYQSSGGQETPDMLLSIIQHMLEEPK